MTDLPVVIIGSRGHAHAVIDTLRKLGRKILFATDADAARHGSSVLDVTVKGADDMLFQCAPGEVQVAMGIAVPSGGVAKAPAHRSRLIETITGKGYRIVTLVHPSAILSDRVSLGEGCQIMAGALIQPACRFGDYTVVGTGVSIEHECVVGDNVHIAPGAVLGGNITIGTSSHIGLGAVICPGLKIGEGATVAAGAVVLSDVEPGQRVGGVPAKRF